jgi:hypothetical protein
MIQRKEKFQARCINNMFKDFGNHTGFKLVDRMHNHLVVGEWYEFERGEYFSENSFVDIIINGKKESHTGYCFKTDVDQYVPEIYNFYKFFSTIQEDRDYKLEKIGI